MASKIKAAISISMSKSVDVYVGGMDIYRNDDPTCTVIDWKKANEAVKKEYQVQYLKIEHFFSDVIQEFTSKRKELEFQLSNTEVESARMVILSAMGRCDEIIEAAEGWTIDEQEVICEE